MLLKAYCPFYRSSRLLKSTYKTCPRFVAIQVIYVCFVCGTLSDDFIKKPTCERYISYILSQNRICLVTTVLLTIALTTTRTLTNIDRNSTPRSRLPYSRTISVWLNLARELDCTLLDPARQRRGLERRVPSPPHNVTISSG